ncbi:MAG TPA: transketolase [Clostridiales bacterium]|jgi:transketolase|nr:transketolase [Clostridiales bacterium]HBE13388.1 transketolase [Clostridiales bacterium]
MQQAKKKELANIAAHIRMGVLTAVHSAKAGHPGGSLSIADILAYLYFEKMNIDPTNPRMEDRDRLVLSKGHTCPGLYAALAHRGYFPVEDLKGFRNINTDLEGHPDMNKVTGVDMTTGSLGLGISSACGMALSGKLSHKNYRVYAILGDGELEEGQVWEATMFAAHYKLSNLTAFVDFNGLQIDGDITKVMNPTPIDEKFRAFNWNVVLVDGHNFDEIEAAVAASEKSERPTVIIAKTIKGKGVSFMENQASWHGSAPNDEQYAAAIAELQAAIVKE